MLINTAQKKLFLNALCSVLLMIWIIFICFHFQHHIQKNRQTIHTRLIDYCMPSFVDFNRFISNAPDVTEANTKNYLKYFEIISKHFPTKHADTILGNLYAISGNFSKAEHILKTALKYDPDFFWTHYNLGLLYFHQKNYPQTIVSMRAALNQSPEISVEKIFSSEAYMQILRKHPSTQTIALLLRNIGKAKLLAQLTISFCRHQQQSAPQNPAIPDALTNIPFQFF